MRLLADLCIANSVIEGLAKIGHDVASILERKINPSDLEILKLARAEGRIVLTEDADFGTLIFTGAAESCGVLRIEQTSADQQLLAAKTAIEEHGTALSEGAVVTVRRGKTRVAFLSKP